MPSNKQKIALDLQGVTFGAGADSAKMLELSQGTTSNIDAETTALKQKEAVQKQGSSAKTIGSGYTDFWDSVLSHNYTDGTAQALITRYNAKDDADPAFTLDVRSKMIDNIDASRASQNKQPLSIEQKNMLLSTASQQGFDYVWTHLQNVETEREWQQSNSSAMDITAGLVQGFGDITNVAGMGAGAAAGAAVGGAVRLAGGVKAAARLANATDFGVDIATGIQGSRLAAAAAGEGHTTDDDIMAAGTALAFKTVVDSGVYAARAMHERFKARQEMKDVQRAPIAMGEIAPAPAKATDAMTLEPAKAAEELKAGKTVEEIKAEAPVERPLTPEDVIDSHEVFKTTDEIVNDIKKFKDTPVEREALLKDMEVNATPEAHDLVKRALAGEDITTDEQIAMSIMRNRYTPEGVTLSEYIRTEDGNKVYQALKEKLAELKQMTSERIDTPSAQSPEAILQREAIEQPNFDLKGRPIERMSVTDTLNLMRDISTNPKNATLEDHEKVITEGSKDVSVYTTLPDGTRKHIKHTLVTPLQRALFYAHKSSSGPITGKRRVAIDYIKKHYSNFSDTEIEQAARAFRMELQRTDTKFNPKLAVKEREYFDTELTSARIAMNDELRDMVGAGNLSYRSALDALTVKTSIDVTSLQYNKNAVSLIESFSKGSEPVSRYTKLLTMSEERLSDINARLRRLYNVKEPTIEVRKAISTLEYYKAQWTQLRDGNLSELALRVKALVEDPSITPETLSNIKRLYIDTIDAITVQQKYKEISNRALLNSESPVVAGSRKSDPKGKYALATTFETGTAFTKRAALEELYSNPISAFTESLVRAGKLKIVETPSEITHGNHPDDVLGMYDRPTDTMYIVAGNITSAKQLDAILMHEATHAKLPDVLGKKGYASMIDTVLKDAEFAEIKAEVLNTYGLDEVKDKYLLGEEIAARAVERFDSEHSFVRGILSAFKAWLIKTFGADIRLSQADLAHIVARSLRKASNESYISFVEGPSIFTEPPKDSKDYNLYALATSTTKAASAIPQSTNPPLNMTSNVGIKEAVSSVLGNIVYNFETSANPNVRLAGRILFTNRDTGTIGATEIYRRVNTQLRNTIQASMEEPFKKYRKENGAYQTAINTPEAIRQAKQFANDVGTALLTGNTTVPESIKEAMAAYKSHQRRIHAEVVNEFNAIERVLGKQLEADDTLSELANQAIDDNYVPTKINREKLDDLRAKINDDGEIVKFVAEAITAKGMTMKEKRTYAAVLIKAINNTDNPDARKAVESMFSGVGNTAHIMELTGMFTKQEIDSVRNVQVAARSSSRPLFDPNFSRDVKGSQVSMMDLLETDVNVLINGFMSPRTSAITMAQSLRSGISTLGVPYDANMPKYIEDVDGVATLNLNHLAAREYLKTIAAESIVKDNPTIHQQHLENIENSLRMIDGGDFDDVKQGLGMEVMQVLSNVTNVQAGWGFTSSLLPEFFREVLSNKQGIKLFTSDLLSGFKNGASSYDNELARDMAEMLGVGFNASFVPSYNTSSRSNVVTDAKHVTGLAAKGVFRVTGFTNLNEYISYTAVRAHLAAFKDAYMTGKALDKNVKDHMILNGIPESKIDRALEYVAKVYDETSGRLSNSNLGYEDVDVQVKSYLNLIAQLAKSEAPFGSMPALAYSKYGKPWMQYRSAMIAAQVVHTMHGAKHMNSRIASQWVASLVGGALSYIVSTIMRYHQDSKKLEQKLQAQEIFKQAFGRASFAGMMPLIADASAVVAGFNPVFTGAQYRDTFTFTPAPLKSFADIMSGIAGVSSTVNPWAEPPSVQERNAALKLFGAAPILTYGLGPVFLDK